MKDICGWTGYGFQGLIHYIQDICKHLFACISGAVSAYNPNEITLQDLADNSGIFLLQVGVASNILWGKYFMEQKISIISFRQFTCWI